MRRRIREDLFCGQRVLLFWCGLCSSRQPDTGPLILLTPGNSLEPCPRALSRTEKLL